MIRSQRGALTIDFLFAFVLIMTFSILLFALTMTLTVAEMTQYITFASARNYFAAHESEIEQSKLGSLKYKQLTENNAFAPLYTNGWFIIEKAPKIGALSKTVFNQYQQPGPEDPDLFWGVATDFTAKILDFKAPLFGSTSPDGDGSGSGFKTVLASYLGREPTSNECYNFNINRWRVIRTLDIPSGAAPYSTGTSDGSYFVVSDNGC